MNRQTRPTPLPLTTRLPGACWVRMRIGSGRRLESLLEYPAMTCYFPETTLIEVNPGMIRRRLVKAGDLPRNRRKKFFLRDEDHWDVAEFSESYQYRLIKEIWHHRDDLGAAPLYQSLLEDIQRGDGFQRGGRQRFALTDEAALIHYMTTYLDIMRDIAENGYRADAGPDELGVAIAGDGELMKYSSGKHRLAMAQVLGIPRIPVRICRIHQGWWRTHTPDPSEPVPQALARVLAGHSGDTTDA
ncbi:hypothetical protein [Ectothiorhodospira shaposhnikovii]|uniref:hypothetical protein n=1 Tax=Ectothiorhodospira shaposhnikovii TaxID=1054 RepID=UPI0019035DCF|nr:hypothetical protein [Ectothiorhodospira shaposhnikovii]